VKLTEEKIREIAEILDIGMRCFYHLKTVEIEATPDFNEPDWFG